MAIDSAAKRFSIQNLACPWRPLVVVPSGSVTQAERQQFLYLYGGIAWDVPSTPEVAPPDDDADTVITAYLDRDSATIRPPRLTVLHAMDSLLNSDLHGADRLPMDTFEGKSDRVARNPSEGLQFRLHAFTSRAGEPLGIRSLDLDLDLLSIDSGLLATDTTAGTDKDGGTMSVATVSVFMASDSVRNADLDAASGDTTNSYLGVYQGANVDQVSDVLRLSVQKLGRAGAVACIAELELELEIGGENVLRAATV